GDAVCDRRARVAALLRSINAAQAYRRGVSMATDVHRLLEPGHGLRGDENLGLFEESDLDALRNFARIDCATYLPADILCKVDRASMAVALEARAPLLDYRVVEHAWRYPTSALVADDLGTKAPLKRLLYAHVPRALVDRPKRGFAVPLPQWLRGPLKGWADALLLDAPADDPLRQSAVADCWARLQRGDDDYERIVWAMLMWRLWCRERLGAPAAAGLA
ncbi:MAG: asparagine synthase-related protein, partial [Pseudomonadota bacterium]